MRTTNKKVWMDDEGQAGKQAVRRRIPLAGGRRASPLSTSRPDLPSRRRAEDHAGWPGTQAGGAKDEGVQSNTRALCPDVRGNTQAKAYKQHNAPRWSARLITIRCSSLASLGQSFGAPLSKLEG